MMAALLLSLALGLSGCDNNTTTPPTAAALPASFADGSNDEAADAGLIGVPEMEFSQGTSTDLSTDSITPPPAPELLINATTGALDFQWDALDDASSVSLYVDDDEPEGEARVDIDLAPDSTSATLPVIPHQVPWQQRRYRVELCTDTDCISSRYVSVAGLASNTMQTLTPAVHLEGERFGQPVALNDDASLAVVGSPLAGTVGLYFRFDDAWTLATDLTLTDGTPDRTRVFVIDVSSSGDTIAVLIKDQSTGDHTVLSIHDRLGEGWFETHRANIDSLQSVSDDKAETDNASIGTSLQADRGLKLSADGDHLLIGMTGAAPLILDRLDVGWERGARLTPPDGYRPSGAVSASNDLQTVFAVAEKAVDASESANSNGSTGGEQTVVLAWNVSADKSVLVGQTTVPGLTSARHASVLSDHTGTRFAVAGIEPANGAETPILWGFVASNPARALGWEPDGSFRFAPLSAGVINTQLRGNHDLSMLAIAINTAEASALQTLHTHSGLPWRTALNLPEDASELARVSFATAIAMDRSGDTLLMGGRDSQLGHRILVSR